MGMDGFETTIYSVHLININEWIYGILMEYISWNYIDINGWIYGILIFVLL